MNKEEIQKLLNFILNNNNLNDQDIIALIYDLVERIELNCFGDKEQATKQKFDRLYSELYYGIFSDLIASFDWLDDYLNSALSLRNKQIVDKGEL